MKTQSSIKDMFGSKKVLGKEIKKKMIFSQFLLSQKIQKKKSNISKNSKKNLYFKIIYRVQKVK